MQWQHAIGNVILVLVQLFSFYQRYRYGTSAVVPLGLVLSLVAVSIMLSPVGRAASWCFAIGWRSMTSLGPEWIAVSPAALFSSTRRSSPCVR